VALDPRIAKLLAKKYKKKFGTKVGDTAQIRKQLGGTRVSGYMAKDGGYIVKKKKKVVKKRKK
jgi:hypothetical protein